MVNALGVVKCILRTVFFLITKVKAFQTFSIACPTDIIHFIIFSWQEPIALFPFFFDSCSVTGYWFMHRFSEGSSCLDLCCVKFCYFTHIYIFWFIEIVNLFPDENVPTSEDKLNKVLYPLLILLWQSFKTNK